MHEKFDSGWRGVSANPLDPRVNEYVRAAVRRRYRGITGEFESFVAPLMIGKSVLDVGAVEHVIDLHTRPGWRHEILKRHAKEILGIDILPGEIEALVAKGYSMQVVDATSDVDLGRRFDVVYLGEVVEHVEDIGRLFKFAKRHVTSGGTIMLTTPNPFYFKHLFDILLHGFNFLSADHVNWIGPTMVLEICRRLDLEFECFYGVGEHGGWTPRKSLRGVVRWLFPRSEFLYGGFFYFIRSKSNAASG